MSNLKIKNQKERTTSFWQFVGIAAIPILLSLFVGYQWGHTSSLENKNYNTLLQKSQAELTSLKNDIEIQHRYFLYSDSLLKKLKEQTSDWDSEYKKSFNSETEDETWDDISERYKKYKDKLNNFDDSGLSKNKQIQDINEQARKYFLAYIQKSKTLTDQKGKVKKTENKLFEGISENFKEEKEEIEKDVDEWKEKADDFEDELSEAQRQVTRYREKLEDCKSGNVAVQDNDLQHATKIISEIEIIQKEIVPKLKDKFLGKRGSLKEKVDELKGSLSIISTAAHQID